MGKTHQVLGYTKRHKVKSILSRQIIGGEFELNTVSLGLAERLVDLTGGIVGTWTISGRAALGLVLRHLKTIGVKHVHLPAYLCESLLLPVKALGLDYSFYPVDLFLRAHPDPPAYAAVLLIHYFGWLNPETIELRGETGRRFYLIEDACQALLSDWSAPLSVERFVLLSPRKFGPVPLGGWCNLAGELERATKEIEALVWRSLAARLVRGAYLRESNAPVDPEVESFYLSAFQAVEEFLDRESCWVAAPRATLEMVVAQDWNEVAQRRCRNWHILNEILSGYIEPMFEALPEEAVPLGYVVRLPETERDRIRKQLAAARIFCPVHWSLPAEVERGRFPGAAQLARTCLTLPVDQRYGRDEMEKIGEVIKTIL